LDNLFPRLENPDLVIYVYPHLATRTRAPIPGYTTVVPLYERVEYRLPGEALLSTPAPGLPAAQGGEGTR
jgi:conjugative transfer region lipoprotein (TIGR03751 family)